MWQSGQCWVGKFGDGLRKRCKRSSVSRSRFSEKKRARVNYKESFERWQKERKEFIVAWEKSERAWTIEVITRAIQKGGVAVWRLLSSGRKMPSRTLVCKDGLIITNPIAIAEKLLDHHQACISENTSVQPGGFSPVVWNKPFTEEDEVLEISNDLVANCIGKLKNTAVPDNILPSVIKLLFGRPDSVQPMGDMIRAVAKTRLFPTDGKVSKQVFIWKGKGLRNILENNRPITMASIPLKLAELCVKSSASLFWSTSGFPREYWGHFFWAPESIYVWMSTVEKYTRRGCRPITLLTDVSKAFERVHFELYKRKLFDFGIPRQLQELILEF